MNLKDLDLPLASDAIEWRVGRAGVTKKGDSESVWCKVLAYLTNRAIQERLDDVCGKENWRNEYVTGPQGGVMCGISIRVEGEWVTKWDGAENTEIESVKGGLSDSMKRAAVQWGIGRYLYQLEEGFAKTTVDKPQQQDEWHFANAKRNKTDQQGVNYWWQPPTLPSWALPADRASRPNGTAPRTESAPVAEDDMTQKDRNIIASCVQLFAEAQSTEAFSELMDMIAKPDSKPSTADHPKEVKAAIWNAVKGSKFAKKRQPVAA